MKRIALLLALILSVSLLGACSDRSATDDPSQEEGGQTTEENSQSSGETERPSLAAAAANNSMKDENEITLVQLQDTAVGAPLAIVHTNEGDITILLYPQYAPMAVENFSTLAAEDFYNGKVFHFAEDDFMIQGGAVNSNGTGSRTIFSSAGGDAEYFDSETDWDLWHFRGAVSLAPDSNGKNGSQFVIVSAEAIYGHDKADLEAAAFPRKVIEAYDELGGIPYRDGVNTVFGHVVDGFDVVTRISMVETDVTGTPTTPVIIESITLVDYDGSPFGQEEDINMDESDLDEED